VATAITGVGTLGSLTVTNTVTTNGNVILGSAVDDTLTVNARLMGGSPLVFEGNTDDEHKITLAVADPGSDVTVTVPAETGTLLTENSAVATAITGVGTLASLAVSGESSLNRLKFSKTEVSAAASISVDMSAAASYVEVTDDEATAANAMSITNAVEGQVLIVKNLDDDSVTINSAGASADQVTISTKTAQIFV
jgi:hypothetical protein